MCASAFSLRPVIPLTTSPCMPIRQNREACWLRLGVLGFTCVGEQFALLTCLASALHSLLFSQAACGHGSKGKVPSGIPVARMYAIELAPSGAERT
eukprot:1655203-Amphidinium_carterae.1